MKKTFTFLPLLLLLLTGNYQKPKPETTIRVQVGFGRAGSCAGRGTCSINSYGTQSTAANTYNGIMGFNEKGSVFLEFKYADLSSDVVSSQFSTALFEMEIEYPIPVGVLQQLNAQQPGMSLRTGFYPIEKTQSSVRITFE